MKSEKVAGVKTSPDSAKLTVVVFFIFLMPNLPGM